MLGSENKMVSPQKIIRFVVHQPTLSIATKASNTVDEWGIHSERFPVHRIYCVARNYRDHSIEMGGDPDREPPFFFQKPADAIVDAKEMGCVIPYPSMTSNLHHEVELLVALDKGGKNIPVEKVDDHIFGYAVGCDLTRRDLQAEAKQHGRAWDSSKGFDYR